VPLNTVRNSLQGNNPLTNILVIILGAVVLGVSLILGFFAFLALSAVVLVAACIVGVRVWWAKRYNRQRESAQHAHQGDTIEGEFHVVKKGKNS